MSDCAKCENDPEECAKCYRNNQQAAREWLPCPFCNGPASCKKDGGSDERCGYNFRIIVQCKSCGAAVAIGSNHDKAGWCNESTESVTSRAHEAWNRRPTPPDSGETDTRDAIAELIEAARGVQPFMPSSSGDPGCEQRAVARFDAALAKVQP